MKKITFLIIVFFFQLSTFNTASAQVGLYRNIFAVGVNGGYVMNKVRFMPEVPQHQHKGYTFGISGRYTCEKYFSTICSIQAEVNVSQLGWTEKIQTIEGNSVINPETNQAEEFQRDITYVEIPLLAHLAWGRERHGINAFIEAGPQFGFVIGDKISTKNYTKPFTAENYSTTWTNTVGRVNSEVYQETASLDSKFDFGIAAGAGIEWDIKKVGRFDLSARYYYGLGNIYSDAKKDEFNRSPNAAIYIKLSYMHDL